MVSQSPEKRKCNRDFSNSFRIRPTGQSLFNGKGRIRRVSLAQATPTYLGTERDARTCKIFNAIGCEEACDRFFCSDESCDGIARARRMWTIDYPAKYLVGSIFYAFILQAQEPTPSPPASRIPLRSHHDDSGM